MTHKFITLKYAGINVAKNSAACFDLATQSRTAPTRPLLTNSNAKAYVYVGIISAIYW
jgi:hypothetical protein